MYETILRDILFTIDERADLARSKPPRDGDPVIRRQHLFAEDAAARRAYQLQQEAVQAFGALNGWRTSSSYHCTPDKLGHPHRYFDNHYCRGWRDHPLYYKAPRSDGKRGLVNVAIVGQPYGLAPTESAELTELVINGYKLHVPPAGPCASIWYPGSTLFLVLTLPDVTVRWLPEQLTAVPELAGRYDDEGGFDHQGVRLSRRENPAKTRNKIDAEAASAA
jgi:hypothetical protein